MTVLVVAGNSSEDKAVPCVICFQLVPLTEVTAGSLYADGQQAFACTIHLGDRARWINQWAAFDAAQRTMATQSNALGQKKGAV